MKIDIRSEIRFQTASSSGEGGQHVNKVETGSITMKRNQHLYIFAIGLMLLLSGFQNREKTCCIQFHHVAGDQPLVLEDSIRNPFGEMMVVHRFRYYISEIVLTDMEGKKASFGEQYFLVDEADSASKTICLPTGIGPLASIEFAVGVDSIRNISGIQTGSLDPMLGMFWTWNSGYIFAKLDGQSTASTMPGHYFTYHIGGFRTGENAIRKIRLNIHPDATKHRIDIRADINRWFQGPTNIHIREEPVCHQPGPLALKIADNYARMFSIMQP